MKNSKTLLLSTLLLTLGTPVLAQDDAPRGTKSNRVTVDIDGVSLTSKTKEEREDSRFLVTYGMVDLGFNRIDDKTDYTFSNGLYDFLGPETNSVVAPPPPAKLSSPYKLNEGKSINVNVWIANTRLRLADGQNQKLYFTSGIGLQMYNFRFDSRKMYVADPNTRMAFVPSELDIQKKQAGLYLCGYSGRPAGQNAHHPQALAGIWCKRNRRLPPCLLDKIKNGAERQREKP